MIRRALARRRYRQRLDRVKLDAIDAAFGELHPKTVADLGGVWAVDGGYSLYAAEVHRARRVVVVDEDISPALRERAQQLPALDLVEANFGTEDAAAAVEEVDVVLLFDVLLHQVDPDWDEVLALYADRTRAFVVVGPQWNGPRTIRLLELGETAYLEAVPSTGEPVYDALFARLDLVHPRRGRRWRDIHDIWQWGITDHDLVRCVEALGFETLRQDNLGPWRGLEAFHTGVFVFARP